MSWRILTFTGCFYFDFSLCGLYVLINTEKFILSTTIYNKEDCRCLETNMMPYAEAPNKYFLPFLPRYLFVYMGLDSLKY